MKAMKKVSARLAKRHAFFGKIDKTATGLKKTDLVKNKAGRIVSKKRSLAGKKNVWIVAVNKARAALKIKGFSVVKKGTPLYKKAKEFLAWDAGASCSLSERWVWPPRRGPIGPWLSCTP